MSNTQYKKVDWLPYTNLYEVNLRQYTSDGNFRAFEKHLPRLKDMGVHCLWFMPFTKIAKKNAKGSLGSYYACASYLEVDEEFGTITEFKNLVNLAHDLGFKVIIDWVANHTGWDHHWTITHPEYYKKDADGNFKKAHDMDDIIELDYNNPQLRLEMIENMRFWVNETKIDGFRCDLCYWVPVDFWHQARQALDKQPLFFLGEYEALDHLEYTQVFDAAYSWKWMHETEELAKGFRSLEQVKNLLLTYSAQLAHSTTAWFTSNHDENSWNGSEYEKYRHLALPLAVFGHLINGIPIVYTGQEIANTKRLAFFDKDCIDWSQNFELHFFYKTLNNIRLDNKASHAASDDVHTQIVDTCSNDKIFAFERKHKNGQKLLVVLNLSDSDIEFSFKTALNGLNYKDIFTQESLKVTLNQFVKKGGFSIYE